MQWCPEKKGSNSIVSYHCSTSDPSSRGIIFRAVSQPHYLLSIFKERLDSSWNNLSLKVKLSCYQLIENSKVKLYISWIWLVTKSFETFFFISIYYPTSSIKQDLFWFLTDNAFFHEFTCLSSILYRQYSDHLHIELMNFPNKINESESKCSNFTNTTQVIFPPLVSRWRMRFWLSEQCDRQKHNKKHVHQSMESVDILLKCDKKQQKNYKYNVKILIKLWIKCSWFLCFIDASQ